MIPLCDLTGQYLALKNEIDAAMQSVAHNAHYILGPQVKAFETEAAAWCGAPYAAGVGNGTDALQLALRALRIGPGDEVITTPFTFVATTEAIGMVGATPVFADIDPDTFNIDPAQIRAAITPRTKCILPVHLYGQPCDMDAIMAIAREHCLSVVEDCAQAIGAAWKEQPVGTFGDAGCFSFFPSKNLGCMGDGGMVISTNKEVYERVEMLRRHGGRVKYHHEELGLNSRLDELQAAILRVKLKRLNGWSNDRLRNAYRYNELLEDVEAVVCPAEISSIGPVIPRGGLADASDLVHCVYHQYTLLADNRDEVVKSLQSAEIGCAVYYPVPLHLQEVHASLGHKPGDFPVAESVAARCFSIPMFPELTLQQQEVVAAMLRRTAVRKVPSKMTKAA